MRTRPLLLLAFVVAACGTSGTTVAPRDVGLGDSPDAVGDADVEDPAALDDPAAPDEDGAGLADVADPGPSDAPDPDADPADDPSQDVPDGTPDAPADAQPGDPGPPSPPFAACDALHPCQDPGQPVCVTPAGKEQGTCLGLCGEGKPACPSWQECVVVDPSQGLSACFVIAAYDDPCSPADGVLCDASRLEYCIAPPADGQARCTRFCDDGPEGPSCPPWQECLATSASASACFRKPPCEGGGCVPVLSPAGAECAPEAGVSCGPGLECVAGAGGWVGHCAAPCATGEDCGAFTVCVDGLCRRADRLIPGAVPCGPAFGCEPGDGGGAAACTPVGPDLSVCLPACDPGPCPAGTACVGGGCAVVSGLGGPCGPDRGLLCAEGLACRIDESLDHHFGHCTRPCGEGCPEGFQCVEGRCGRTAGYGGSCSGVAGTFCDPADPGLVCKVLRPGTRSGFCTASCQIGQSCPDPGGDLAATCMLVASPGWLCALTCGDLGGTCPPHLQCGTFGVCL